MNETQIAEVAGVKVDKRLTAARKSAARLVAAVQAAGMKERAALVTAYLSGPLLADMRHLKQHDPETLAAALGVIESCRGAGKACKRLERLIRLRVVAPVGVEAPAGVPATMPSGYRVTAAGVVREEDGAEVRVTSRPVYVAAYLDDVDTGEHYARITWRQVAGHWAGALVPLSQLADARAIVGLAGLGLPVTSASARELVAYLDRVIAVNAEAYPRRRLAGRLGWVDVSGFLYGAEWIGAGSVQLAEDAGIRQVAAGYVSGGSWPGWVAEVVQEGRKEPAVWLAIYAAVASLLVEPLGVRENAAIDWSGETSRGKTTAQRVAASVVGDPRHVVKSWKVTPAGVEAYASILCSFPLILDDTKKARRDDDVAGIVYMHSGGSGAVRGKPGRGGRGVGLRRVESWRSWLISSGEQRLTDFSRDAGTRARVLCLVGSPLSCGTLARRLSLGAERHYGHLGRRVLRWLLAGDHLAELRQHHAGIEYPLSGAVSSRLGDAVAVLEAAKYAAEAAGLPAPSCNPIRVALDAARRGGEDADQPAEALRVVWAWCVQRQGDFFERTPAVDQPAERGRQWLGRWEHGDTWAEVAIVPRAVREVLDRHGFDRGVVARWKERGWLTTDPSRRTRATRIGGVLVRCVVLSRDVISEVCL